MLLFSLYRSINQIKSFIIHSVVSAPNQLLWALVGLLLTIAGTFVEASVTDWNWTEQAISFQPLGMSYQVAAVLLTGCVGGQNAGAIAQIAYLVLGLFWLPIFAQGGGIEYFKEPSFGYLLGFVPGAWLCGWLAFRTKAKLETLALSCVAGLLVIHLCGIVYLVGLAYLGDTEQVMPSTLQQAIAAYSVEPLLGQLIIVCAAAVVGLILRRILFY